MVPAVVRRPLLFVLFFALIALSPLTAFAQQTGAVNGKVMATDGSVLPGVTIEATADVLPAARVTISGSVGEYRLPALPPGSYTLTFTLAGMGTVTRTVEVQLDRMPTSMSR